MSLLERADPLELVREPATTWASPGEEQSFPGVKWTLSRFRDRPDLPEHELVVWFSEEHGWLPRMIVVRPIGPFQKNKAGLVVLPAGCRSHQVTVLEFMAVFDPLLDRNRHFPRTVRDAGNGWDIATLTSVQVNQAVPDHVFELAPAVGTMIVREPGTPREHHEYTGGVEGERQHRELMEKNREYLGLPKPATSTTGPVTANLAKINAAPETLRWPVGRLVFGMAIVLLAIAGAAKFRGRSV